MVAFGWFGLLLSLNPPPTLTFLSALAWNVARVFFVCLTPAIIPADFVLAVISIDSFDVKFSLYFTFKIQRFLFSENQAQRSLGRLQHLVSVYTC